MLNLTVIFLLVSSALIISKPTHFNFAPMIQDVQTGELIRYVTTGSWLGNNLLVIAVLFIVFALSRLSRKYIELPGLNFGEKFLFRKKLVPQILCELK